MKLIMENWKRFLKEGIDPGIDPRIQKQIDILMADPELFIQIEELSTTTRFSYKGSDKISGYIDISPPDEKIVASGAECYGAWDIWYTSTITSNMGPLLYEVAIEWASEEPRKGLMSDRTSVTAPAKAVWQKYSDRPDETGVQKLPLDLTPDEAARTGLKQITPRKPEDDCDIYGVKQWKWDPDWQENPLNKVYRKPYPEVTKAILHQNKDKLIYKANKTARWGS